MATFTNQATLTYNGNVITSNIASGEIIEVLSATKTAAIDTYSRDSQITYIIQIVNSGTTAFSGITLSDNLGAYTFGVSTLVPLNYVDGSVRYYTNGVLQAAPTVSTDSGLSISGISVPAGGNATIIYIAETNQYAPFGVTDSITNIAVLSGNGFSDITVNEMVTPVSEAVLSITKTLSPTTVTENGRLTYTFTIQNTGNVAVTAADSVTITDTFDPILTDIVVTFNGTVWTENTNYTYSDTVGEFASARGQITVPAATYTQNPLTGVWGVEPGVSILTITGTI